MIISIIQPQVLGNFIINILKIKNFISASDRSETIRALANPNLKPNDFLRPGHIFPLIAKKGGLLERRGHTEVINEIFL